MSRVRFNLGRHCTVSHPQELDGWKVNTRTIEGRGVWLFSGYAPPGITYTPLFSIKPEPAGKETIVNSVGFFYDTPGQGSGPGHNKPWCRDRVDLPAEFIERGAALTRYYLHPPHHALEIYFLTGSPDGKEIERVNSIEQLPKPPKNLAGIPVSIAVVNRGAEREGECPYLFAVESAPPSNSKQLTVHTGTKPIVEAVLKERGLLSGSESV
ncbi:MAG: hypothetical protein HY362_04700 [Candidatus Aenigmarchaeota archaeon]|nr:hypothetical protein [Candidatus Aenigmarchaeota archaeon]